MRKTAFCILLLGLFAVSAFVLPNVQSANSLNITSTIPLSDTPKCISVNNETNRIYVGTDAGVIVIDGNTDTVVTLIPTVASVRDIAVNSKTNRVFAFIEGENVLVLDGATNQQVGALPDGDYISYDHVVLVNPVTNLVYYCIGTATLGKFDVVKVYDGSTLGLVATVNIPTSDTHRYIEMMSGAVNPATNKVYVAWTGNDSINIIDGATNTVTSTVSFTAFSRDIAVNPYTNLLYMKKAVYNGDTLAAVGQTYPGDVLAIDAVHNYVYTADYYTLNVLNGSTQGVMATLKFNWYLDGFGTVAAVNPTTSKLYIAGANNQTTVVTLAQTPTPSPTQTQTPTQTPSSAPSLSPTPTATIAPSPTPLSTASLSTSPSPTATASLMPSSSSTPLPSPTIPEVPALAVLTLFLVVLLAAVLVRYQKKPS